MLLGEEEGKNFNQPSHYQSSEYQYQLNHDSRHKKNIG